VLVCAAVKRERKLRSMFNYFLVSLALSDMLSAILVMPLSIMRSLVGQNVCELSFLFTFTYVKACLKRQKRKLTGMN